MWRIVLMLLPFPAFADSLVATRVIKAQTELTADDVTLVAMDIPGALSDAAAAIGQEARVAIYPGRPIRAVDLGQTAVVDRNQVVPLAYIAGGLTILTEGRALSRGGVGDVIDVMNLASRATVSAIIGVDGVARVGPIS